MRKYILLAFFISSITLIGQAQIRPTINEFSFSIGPSLPVGAFSKKDLGDEKAGFASVGEQCSVSLERKFNSKWGITATLLGARNPVAKREMEKQLDNAKFVNISPSGNTSQYPPGVPFDPSNPPVDTRSYTGYPNWEISAKSWWTVSLLIGPSIHIPISDVNKKLSFTAKAMAGMVYLSSPYIEGHSDTDTVKATLTQSHESGIGLSWLANAAIKYQQSKKVSFIAALDYLGAFPVKFEGAASSMSVFNNHGGNNMLATYSMSSQAHTVKQPIALLNVSIGMHIKL